MITFKTYEYWPDLKLMEQEPGDKYDFIGFGFQITVDTESDKKDYLTFFAYVVVDKYDNAINLTFDFATESDGSTIYWSLSREKEKKTSTRKIKIGNDYDEVKLKLNKHLDIKPESLNEFIQHYYAQILNGKITEIESYAKKHDITFYPENIKAWYSSMYESFSNIQSNEFIEKIKTENYPLSAEQFLKTINIYLAYERLTEKLDKNPENSPSHRFKI